MEYDYFVASRWRNKDQVKELVQQIRQKGKTVYSFLEGDGKGYQLKTIDPNHDPEVFMEQFENIPNWQTDPEVKRVFDVDMEALKNSKHVILLLPAGKSAHIEAGVAYGLGKDLSVIGEQKEAESLYMIFQHFSPTIKAFVDTLK